MARAISPSSGHTKLVMRYLLVHRIAKKGCCKRARLAPRAQHDQACTGALVTQHDGGRGMGGQAGGGERGADGALLHSHGRRARRGRRAGRAVRTGRGAAHACACRMLLGACHRERDVVGQDAGCALTVGRSEMRCPPRFVGGCAAAARPPRLDARVDLSGAGGGARRCWCMRACARRAPLRSWRAWRRWRRCMRPTALRRTTLTRPTRRHCRRGARRRRAAGAQAPESGRGGRPLLSA